MTDLRHRAAPVPPAVLPVPTVEHELIALGARNLRALDPMFAL
jgi:hypothetical protein